MDIAKHIAYWRNGALEEWEVSLILMGEGRIRQGLFFGHLALEKILKAHVCKRTNEVPPRIHNLLRLGHLAGIELDNEQSTLLSEMNRFSMEGRYPDNIPPPPDKAQARSYMNRAEKILTWLNQLL